VVEALAGIRRSVGRPPQGKDPVLTAHLASMLAGLDRGTLAGARDAAVLLFGFASGARRSELSALDWAHLVIDGESEDGERAEAVTLLIHRSKTDQKGRGQQVAVAASADAGSPLCPVRALLAYRNATAAALGILPAALHGPVFRPVTRYGKPGVPGHGTDVRLSPAAIADIVKRHARSAGLDPKAVAGHSLRSGFATQASRGGANEADIAEHMRHRSVATTRRYVRRAKATENSASRHLGL
jgi:integrase